MSDQFPAHDGALTTSTPVCLAARLVPNLDHDPE